MEVCLGVVQGKRRVWVWSPGVMVRPADGQQGAGDIRKVNNWEVTQVGAMSDEWEVFVFYLRNMWEV